MIDPQNIRTYVELIENKIFKIIGYQTDFYVWCYQFCSWWSNL